MKNNELDQILSGIRNETPEPGQAEQAASRVWTRLAGPRNVHEIRIQDCSGFQALIPAYLDRTLSESRRLLFQDHIHECVPCRRALEAARSAPVTLPLRSQSRKGNFMPWAVAATLLLGIGIGSYGAINGLLPGQHPVRATVQSIRGSLYRVSDQGSTLLSGGNAITDGEEIRTARGSHAVIRLVDGSLVEMGERTDLAVFRGWRGATVHLERGPVIIQAAHQRLGRLYVSTEDCLVSVKGTVFSVNQGTKGSRISVIEGAVEVAQGGNSQLLHPGQQTTTSTTLAAVPISDEISWSQNAPQYLALLGEFSTIGKQIAAIPEPGLRYQSSLARYVPENTVIFASIPNLTNTLAEANRIFEDRLQQSAVLREWWSKQGSRSSNIQEAISKIQAFGSYLGDEILIAVGRDSSGHFSTPLILAQSRQSGLRDFLQNQGAAVHLVDNPAFDTGISKSFNVYLKNNILAASPDATQLRYVQTMIGQEAQSRFLQTPFYSRIAKSYEKGAGWLLAADMEQIAPASVKDNKAPANPVEAVVKPSIGNVQYLVVERRPTGAQTETSASLNFSSERQGIASWLAAPGPMGSLDFVSASASLAASFVIKNPRTVVQELMNSAATSDPQFSAQLAEFQSKTGINVLDDIAAPLGGEVTVAIDGPVLPTPSWKLIGEVYDPVTLQNTIAKLVQSFNSFAPPDKGQLQLAQDQQGSQTYYTLTSTTHPGIEIDYTFSNGYWIAAPSRALLVSAMQSRENGNSLRQSAGFRALLPGGGQVNFSALLYHNLAQVVGPLSQQIQASGLATAEQQKAIAELQANSTPGLIYAYGEPDRIVVASNTGFLGMNLDTLLMFNMRGPAFLPQLLKHHARGGPQIGPE